MFDGGRGKGRCTLRVKLMQLCDVGLFMITESFRKKSGFIHL